MGKINNISDISKTPQEVGGIAGAEQEFYRISRPDVISDGSHAGSIISPSEMIKKLKTIKGGFDKGGFKIYEDGKGERIVPRACTWESIKLHGISSLTLLVAEYVFLNFPHSYSISIFTSKSSIW